MDNLMQKLKLQSCDRFKDFAVLECGLYMSSPAVSDVVLTDYLKVESSVTASFDPVHAVASLNIAISSGMTCIA
jgi:hypothetical protein